MTPDWQAIARNLLQPGIRPSTWLLCAVFGLITFFQYSEHLGQPATITHLTENLGLTRYTVERILYLIPIIWAGFIFGWRGSAIVSLVAVACMMPRAVFESPRPEDAIVETIAIFIVGNLAGFSLESLRKERERRAELETAQAGLQSQLRVIEQNEKRLAALNETSAIVSQSIKLGQVLNSAVASVVDVMIVDAVRIYIINEDTGELRLAAYKGISEEFATTTKVLGFEEGRHGKVALSGNALYVEDASQDNEPDKLSIKNENLRSQLIVPLRSKGKVMGTLGAATHNQRTFLPEEIDLLTAIGNQIGVAIENARLYQQELEISEQLKFSEQRYRELFESAHDAIWLHDMEGKIITSNKACTRLTGYSVDELQNIKISDILSEDSLATVKNAEQCLILGESFGSIAEVHMNKKDHTVAIVQLAVSLISENNVPIGFQYVARDITGEKQLQQNLRFLLQQINQAQEEERKRIAQELHDDTIQALVVHCQNIDHVTSGLRGISKETRSQMQSLHQDANNIMQGVRRLSQDLRPAALDNLGLVPALRWLAADVSKFSGITIDVNVYGKERKLTDEAELVLFRIAQEALRNVWKHAHASSSEINLEFTDKKTRISVTDNGNGFNPPHDLSHLSRDRKMGLAGMQERAQLIGGTLKVVSSPGEGTTLAAELPL